MKTTIRDFIENGGDFEITALELYAWQRANNPEYDRFCGAVRVNHWSEIPAVPSTLFRDLHLTCFPGSEAAFAFHTSGTTTGRPGVIRLQDTEIYDLSARRHAEACLGGLPARGVSLAPSAATSSLGHMCRLRPRPGASLRRRDRSGCSIGLVSHRAAVQKVLRYSCRALLLHGLN